MLRPGRKQGSRGVSVRSQTDKKTDWGCKNLCEILRQAVRRSEVLGGKSVRWRQMTDCGCGLKVDEMNSGASVR